MGSWTIVFIMSGLAALLFMGCQGDSAVTITPAGSQSPAGASTHAPDQERPSTEGSSELEYAEVLLVSASGIDGDYSLSVTVQSPDTGCARYADWWEVVSPEGQLIYRRVLLHSHVDEQPFSRSGGPVNIQPDEEIIVRAHMNDAGYGGKTVHGSIAGGFTAWYPGTGFAPEVEKQPPQPSGCGF